MLIKYLLLIYLTIRNHKIHCSFKIGPNDILFGVRVFNKRDDEVREHLVNNADLLNITFTSKLIIDFGSVCYIESIDLWLVPTLKRQKLKINLLLRENSPHDKMDGSCITSTNSSESTNRLDYLFVCKAHSRFGEFVTDIPMNLMTLVIKGFRLYSERFVGCFIFKNYGSLLNASSFTDCLKDCHENSFLFASFKENEGCTCSNNLTELTPVDGLNCYELCDNKYLCGSKVHVAVYHAEPASIVGYKHERVKCIFNKSSCPICEPGYYGIWCHRRDCSINNGGCGNFTCETYETGLSPIVTCKCYNRFKPDIHGNCYDENIYATTEEIVLTFEKLSSIVHVNITSISNKLPELSLFVSSVNPDTLAVAETRLKDENFSETNLVDYCLSDNMCDTKSTMCVTVGERYECVCLNGFRPHSSNKCEDVNECSFNRHVCDRTMSKCMNTIGSYYCLCFPPHIGLRSYNCEDINECKAKRMCDPNTSRCVNIYGSFRCKCNKGYEFLTKYKCKDINECNWDRHTCDSNNNCINTIGSYHCNCGGGLMKEEYNYLTRCQDIDECINDSLCNRTFSICINLYGSYSCECLSDYEHYEYGCRPLVPQLVEFEFEQDYLTPLPVSAVLQDISISQRFLFLVLFVLVTFTTSTWLICRRNDLLDEMNETDEV